MAELNYHQSVLKFSWKKFIFKTVFPLTMCWRKLKAHCRKNIFLNLFPKIKRKLCLPSKVFLIVPVQTLSSISPPLPPPVNKHI